MKFLRDRGSVPIAMMEKPDEARVGENAERRKTMVHNVDGVYVVTSHVHKTNSAKDRRNGETRICTRNFGPKWPRSVADGENMEHVPIQGKVRTFEEIRS
uniref:Retrotransposon protein n=1 Tax=Steinernema glaseri TaxID=37863 RepID=A0A1I7ZM15_9BILA